MIQTTSAALAHSIARRLFGQSGAVRTEPYDDFSIINKVCDGESEAFGILVAKYENYVFTIVKWMVESDDKALDISQEVFLRAYRGIRRFEQKADFKTWLYKIAYNTSLNHIKQKHAKYLNEVGNFEDIPYSGNDDISLRLTFDKLIKSLKPELRAVIVLHYYHDLKYEEIAEIMDSPLNTVKIRLFKAKRQLKGLWDKYAA